MTNLRISHINLLIFGVLLISGYGCQTHKEMVRQADSEESEDRMGHYEYISQYKDIAIRKMHEDGIPASITLAQGILESEYGNSMLARKANNHFGIKCNDGWEGPVVYKNDDNINDCFRKYRSARQSYIDHSKYLTGSDRYNHLFDLPITAYKKWARGLQKAGYATNPSYANLLIKIIEKYKLYQYDQVSKQHIATSDTGEHLTAQTTYKIFEHNRIETVKARKEDTPLKFANKFNIPLQKLLKYNDLRENKSLKKGQFFYLQPKRRNNWNAKFHIVREDETMKDISQKYGVQLDLLYKRNNLSKGQQPAPEEKIYINQRRKDTVQVRSETPQPSPQSKQQSHYTVKKGDTLYSIAQQYQMEVEQLKNLNDLQTNNIEPGQKLLIK